MKKILCLLFLLGSTLIIPSNVLAQFTYAELLDFNKSLKRNLSEKPLTWNGFTERMMRDYSFILAQSYSNTSTTDFIDSLRFDDKRQDEIEEKLSVKVIKMYFNGQGNGHRTILRLETDNFKQYSGWILDIDKDTLFNISAQSMWGKIYEAPFNRGILTKGTKYTISLSIPNALTRNPGYYIWDRTDDVYRIEIIRDTLTSSPLDPF